MGDIEPRLPDKEQPGEGFEVVVYNPSNRDTAGLLYTLARNSLAPRKLVLSTTPFGNKAIFAYEATSFYVTPFSVLSFETGHPRFSLQTDLNLSPLRASKKDRGVLSQEKIKVLHQDLQSRDLSSTLVEENKLPIHQLFVSHNGVTVGVHLGLRIPADSPSEKLEKISILLQKDLTTKHDFRESLKEYVKIYQAVVTAIYKADKRLLPNTKVELQAPINIAY